MLQALIFGLLIIYVQHPQFGNSFTPYSIFFSVFTEIIFTFSELQEMLVFPELDSKEDVEYLNHLAAPVEKFFNEMGKLLTMFTVSN